MTDTPPLLSVADVSLSSELSTSDLASLRRARTNEAKSGIGAEQA